MQTGAMKRNETVYEFILVGAIWLLAAWLRFHHLDRAEFLWDQAEISKWALRVGQQHRVTWIGPISSTRLDTFPAAIWLLAIPYAISTNPVFATRFVAALNIAPVIGGYFIVRRWFGRVAALVATLLFAVAPWAVIYSRKIWHTELLPPFVLLFYVITGWLAFVCSRPRPRDPHRRRWWPIVLHSLALATLIQIHFTGLAFIPLTVLWALLFRRRFDWRAVPFGILAAGLTFIPYFVVDAQQDWRNIHLFVELLKQPTVRCPEVVRYAWIITTGLDLHWLTGADRFPDFAASTMNLRWMFPTIGLLAIAGGLLAIVRAILQARSGLEERTATALMVTTWLVMPALFLFRGKTHPAPHYFTTTLPAQFILAGWSLSTIWRWAGRLVSPLQKTLRATLGVSIVVLAIAQAYEAAAVLRFVMTHDTPRGYGTPLAYELQAVQTAIHLGQGDDAELVLLAEGDDPRMYEMPAVADVLMIDDEDKMPHRAVDIRTALVFPAGPTVYWATYHMTPGEELLATFTSELTSARIPLRENARSFRFYRWAGGPPAIPGLHALADMQPAWQNGARLIGYQMLGGPRPGETFHWALVWEATQTPVEDTYYHWFNHLLDPQGNVVAQADGPSFLPAYWRPGDTVLNWFDLPIPPETPPASYTMRVGMYAYPSMETVPLLAETTATDRAWVTIGPLSREE